MADNEAKVQIGAEIGGLKSGMDQAASAVGNASNQIKSSLETLNQGGQGLKAQFEQITPAISSATSAFTGMAGPILALVGVSATLAGAFELVKKSISAIDARALETIATTAMALSRANIQGVEAQKAAYADYKAYVLGMYAELGKETERHFASGKEMQQTFGAFAKQGIFAAKEEANAVGVVTDAVKLLHGGYIDNLTAMHEIRGVLEGHAGMHYRLAQILAGQIGPQWKEIVQQHIQDGTILKFMEEQFKGLATASEDIQKTLSAQMTTFYTLISQVGRAGLQGAYEQIVQKVRDINDYLREHQELIGTIRKAWENVSGIADGLATGIGGATKALISFAAELDKIAQNPALMAIIGAAGGSRFGPWGAFAGGVAGLGGAVVAGGNAASQKEIAAAGVGPYGEAAETFYPTPEATKPANTPSKTGDKGGAGGGASILQEWKAELEQLKVEQDKYLDFSKEEERKFWQDKLAACQAGSKEYRAVQHELFTLEKGIAKEAYAAKIADLDRQIGAETASWDKKKSLMAEEVNLARANYGQKSAEYDRMLKKQQQLDLQYDKWKKDLDARKVEEEAKLALMDLARKEQQIKFEEQMGLISGNTAIQQLNALKNQELMVEQQAINRKKVIRQGDEKEMEKLASQEAEFKKKKLLEMDKAEQTSALKTRQMFSTLLSPISNAISTTINGMIQGTLTLQQAIANLGQSMLASIVGFLAKMLEQWIITWIMAAIFPKVTNAGLIASDAAVAAAAAYASTCAIPVVGPTMAPFAAAMAYGEVMAMMPLASAAGGWWEIPEATMANLHPKEMVLPPWAAEGMRNLIGQGGQAQGGQAQGRAPAPTIIIQAIDSQDVARFVQKHGNTLFSGQFQPQRNSRPLTTFKNINGTGKY